MKINSDESSKKVKEESHVDSVNDRKKWWVLLIIANTFKVHDISFLYI